MSDLDRLDADIAGVPSDEGSPFMPGSRFGPCSIREHSMRFAGRGNGYYDPGLRREFRRHELTHGRIVDAGDAEVLPIHVAGTFDNVTDMVRRLFARGALTAVLGGDHGITYPVVRTYAEPSTWSTSTRTWTTCRSSTGSS